MFRLRPSGPAVPRQPCRAPTTANSKHKAHHPRVTSSPRERGSSSPTSSPSTPAKATARARTTPSAATTTMLRARETAGTDHLWAKAAELERDFAGYKRRLAERRAQQDAIVAEAAGRRAGGDVAEEEEDRAGDAAGKGRRYEEYVRRRDERLRQEWRARMERKEAEVQALWARLDRTTSSRGSRRGGGVDHDGAELTAAAREDQVKPPQKKPGNLVVKAKPSTPVTPRGNPGHPPTPAAKLARPRTSVPSSLAAGSPSPRLSTPDHRRRPSHLHRGQPQPQPPATPRKENNRLLPPPPPLAAAAASPATPRPRTSTTMLSRSRSMFKDRGSSSVAVGESATPRPTRFQPPRSSYDGASASGKHKEPTPSPRADYDAIALVRSSSCSRELPAIVAVPDRKKASAVAPEPFLVKRSSGNDIIGATSAPLVASKERHLPYSSEITTPAGCGNADNKINQQEYVKQCSDKFGSEEITGDSDIEPSYVFIKKDSDEQIPRPPPQAPAGRRTCPAPEPRSDNKEDSDKVEDTMESTGSNEVAGETPTTDAEEELRRESSESLYSNVQSSFSTRSELDTSATGSPLPSATEQSPESITSPWTGKKSTEVEGAEKRPPTPTTPRSSVQSSPMDAVNGLKRLLTFGKRNGKASDAVAAVERAPNSMAPAPPATAGGDGSVSGECPAGSSTKLRVDSSDDLDSSYVISPHVGSLQSTGPSYPASSELKEPVLHAKSPRVHRSFFSFSTFKSRAN